MFKTHVEQKQLLFLATLDLLEALGTPYACGVAICLRYNELTSLVRVDPNNYLTASRVALDLQAYALVAKSPYYGSGDGRRERAIEAFFESEAANSETNQRLTTLTSPENIRHRHMLNVARDELFRLIGAGPDRLSDFRFGPGATTSLRAASASLFNKAAHPPEVSYGAVQQLRELCEEHAIYGTLTTARAYCINNSNSFTTVPKDWNKDRGICIEPDANIVVQLSLGAQLRRRLQRRGYDLDFLSFHHKELARLASVDGTFATIDLASASDSVSSELVRRILPTDWFVALNKARTAYTTIGGNTIRVEKFSSMGNGFTFELETCIFLAFAKAACRLYGNSTRDTLNWNLALPVDYKSTGKFASRRTFSLNKNDCSVFGDDIIVPTSVAPRLIEHLSFFGFKVNGSKSFLSGPFRESCGGDYFHGEDVRPIFLKDFPTGLEGLTILHNQIYLITERHGLSKRALKRVLSSCPERLRLFGPPAEELSPYFFSPCRGSWKVKRDKFNHYRLLRYLYLPLKHEADESNGADALMLYALLGGESTGFAIRGAERRRSMKWVPTYW